MKKTYNYYKRDGEHWFEWADGESKHVTKCSFHGCIQLGMEFDKFGYDLDTACEFCEQDVNENSAGDVKSLLAGLKKLLRSRSDNHNN